MMEMEATPGRTDVKLCTIPDENIPLSAFSYAKGKVLPMQLAVDTGVEGNGWAELVVDDLRSRCRVNLQKPLSVAYESHRWAYDALAVCSDTRQLRGRKPVVVGRIGDRPLVVKRLHHGGLMASVFGDAFLTSARATSHVALAAYLASHGIATPQVAFVSWRRVNAFVRCEVGFELVDGAVDADTYFFGEATPADGWEARAREIGRTVARLHQVGFLHADLNLMNFLFGTSGEAYVLDLDKSVLPRRLPRLSEYRRNLNRLARSIRKQGLRHPQSLVDQIIVEVGSSYRATL